MRFIIIIFLLTFYSCGSVKDFQSNYNLSLEIIEYLKKENKFNDDFLETDLKEKQLSFCPKISDPYWVVPSTGLSEAIKIGQSNNNVSIAIFGDRLYLAFRTGQTHFASRKTSVYVISSKDGKKWKEELYLNFEKDIREPYLISITERLHFYFFTAGTKMSEFTPEQIYHYEKEAGGIWEEKGRVLSKGEVHWSMKKRGGKTYLSSYTGSHYKLKGESNVSLFFKETTDGKYFYPELDSAQVHFGGVSECGFEFDYSGNLWGVTRLEDGDETGFGSHIIYADSAKIREWDFPEKANKTAYMSPKMFNHNNEIYLISRKQLGKKPFGKTNEKKSIKKQRLRNWVGYSLTPKTSALYKLNKQERALEWLTDLPGNGDTGFPSIIRLSEHKFLVANYSSPLNRKKKRSWLSGQLGRTGIYLLTIEFLPCEQK